jgi:hypothetical protein
MKVQWQVIVAEDRAHRPQDLQDEGRGRADVFDYIERALLQSEAQALDHRISGPYGVRAEGRTSLSACQQNRVQAIQRPQPLGI